MGLIGVEEKTSQKEISNLDKPALLIVNFEPRTTLARSSSHSFFTDLGEKLGVNILSK
jgi:hypothetical protein